MSTPAHAAKHQSTTGVPAGPAGPLPVHRRIPGHHQPTPFYLTADMFGGLPMEVAGGEISGMIGVPVADPHRHPVPEVYLLLSPVTGGAVIDVVVDGHSFEVTAPGAFYVPAGAEHHFLTRSAVPGSYCLGLLLTQQDG